MSEPREVPRELAELDRSAWHLWLLSLAISTSLAVGIVLQAIPTLKQSIIQIGTRHIEMLPQLLVGFPTLVILTLVYIVIRQRELNRMRDFILSAHSETPHLPAVRSQDALTGVFDRRGLSDILELEALRACRHHSPFSVVLCDIQHFRNFNEQEGNLAGDQVLQELAGILRATVRKTTDIVVRYGPDEFLCVLPAADSQGGEIFLRRAEKAAASSRRLRNLTLDLGVATYRAGVELDTLLTEAEKDLDRKRTASGTEGRRPHNHLGQA